MQRFDGRHEEVTSWLVACRPWLFTCLVSVLPATVFGCGAGETGTVSGTVVKKDGTPLVEARVVARSAETGRSAQATTDSNGKFELNGGDNGEGLAPGEYDVMVLEDRGDPDARRPPAIAAKYRNHETSGLEVTVVPGESTELNLTLDPK